MTTPQIDWLDDRSRRERGQREVLASEREARPNIDPQDRPGYARNIDPLVERIRDTLAIIGSLSPNALTEPEKLDVAASLVAQGVRELNR